MSAARDYFNMFSVIEQAVMDEKSKISNQKLYFEACLSNLTDFISASHSIPIASDPVITSIEETLFRVADATSSSKDFEFNIRIK